MALWLAYVMSPLISVVLPVYNAEGFVGAALDSLRAQSWPDFEAIVLDDGSTDRSSAVIQKHIAGDARFRMVTRPNKGLVATLNEGVVNSRGKYIFRMDADDVSHPERFERELAYLESHHDCVAVGTRMLLGDEQLLPIIEMGESLTHEEIDAENLRGRGSAMCHPSTAIRRDALLSVGGYRSEFEWAEDLDLFLRLGEVGRLANLPDVLLTYRQHLTSVGYSKRRIQVERSAAAVGEALVRRGIAPRAPNAAEASESAASYVDPSVAAIHRKWSWWALQGGFPKTARKHAFKAFKLDPFSPANPKLLACALRGY